MALLHNKQNALLNMSCWRDKWCDDSTAQIIMQLENKFDIPP